MLESVEPHGDVRDFVCDLAARFGASRLMWGSDYSQTHDHPYPELVARQRHAASRARCRGPEWYLGRTALTVWPELARVEVLGQPAPAIALAFRVANSSSEITPWSRRRARCSSSAATDFRPPATDWT